MLGWLDEGASEQRPETLAQDLRGQSYFNIEALSCFPSSLRERGGSPEAPGVGAAPAAPRGPLAPVKPSGERRLAGWKWSALLSERCL